MKKNKKTQEETVEQIDEVSVEMLNLQSQLARALADYENLRKRVEREKEEGKYLSKLLIISRLLPVFDMFIDAQKHTGDAGIGIALKVLSDTLKEEGVVEIEAGDGILFDEQLHEAIDTVETTDEAQAGKIAELLMKGYRFIDGPVIRHAKVRAYKQKV